MRGSGWAQKGKEAGGLGQEVVKGVSELARGAGARIQDFTALLRWELVLSLPVINLTSLKTGLGNHIETLQRIHAPPMAAALKLF